VCNWSTDESRPLGTGWQEQVSNHLQRLRSKALAVSTEGKGMEPGQVAGKEEDRKGTTDHVSKARTVMVTDSNRRLRTSTHGGLARVGG
jgi:hypothetical protein